MQFSCTYLHVNMPVNKSYINVYTYFVEPTPENTKFLSFNKSVENLGERVKKESFFLLIFIFDSEVS